MIRCCICGQRHKLEDFNKDKQLSCCIEAYTAFIKKFFKEKINGNKEEVEV